MKNKIESRKEEIIRVATKLFKEKGYSAVTMRDIAKSMGIKAASLYNHINSKQDILKTIIISLAEQFTAGMLEIKSSGESCVNKLKAIIKLHVTLSSQNIYGMSSLNNDWMHLEEQLPYYIKLRSEYEDDFKNILEQGIGKGELINVKPDVMMFSILTTLRSLYLWIPKKEDIDLHDLTENLSQILLDGINK
ncbi:TetR/AcrR family transcriptional regulator [Winogradskyella sp. KYW1333]|uniref:TetR/AcrR family transcriptional regulator n=1 Tax=Winogradskyella sp. KYW1333 TaxID=2282123 RepID=UPI000DF177CD|nr:TetR/AcrR family transcriptional regulator [Winogradskyella sp. KYW1333]RCT56068.1 TetR/AcrR family transcriptional regulator [Winogradskyella sp. KYW1333]